MNLNPIAWIRKRRKAKADREVVKLAAAIGLALFSHDPSVKTMMQEIHRTGYWPPELAERDPEEVMVDHA